MPAKAAKPTAMAVTARGERHDESEQRAHVCVQSKRRATCMYAACCGASWRTVARGQRCGGALISAPSDRGCEKVDDRIEVVDGEIQILRRLSEDGMLR